MGLPQAMLGGLRLVRREGKVVSSQDLPEYGAACDHPGYMADVLGPTELQLNGPCRRVGRGEPWLEQI